MRNRAMLIVVVVVGCSSMVWGQGIHDVVFYDTFDSGDTAGWWAPARVGETGQETCYTWAGATILCGGTGQDGELRPGVAWPEPRFVDNEDGTVTDMLTGLVWLEDASCAELGPNGNGTADWVTALTVPGALADGVCGLTDGSSAGVWRLPSINELQSLIDYEFHSPALSNAAGTARWTEGDVFSGVNSGSYWSSTSCANDPSTAWLLYVGHGDVYDWDKTFETYVWPVRSGQVVF